MSDKSAIEWTEATWNPVVGCTRVSAGCDHCYAVGLSRRLEGFGKTQYRGLTVVNPRGERHFNGTVRTIDEALTIPLRWRKARRIFVNSMSDLFHRDVPFEFIDKVFAVMALCPQHTFQILTKRPERMVEYLTRRELNPAWSPTRTSSDDAFRWKTPCDRVYREVHNKPRSKQVIERGMMWPLPNVWLGTSCEDQTSADERIPHLLRCPAAVRFLSCEPLLGPVDLAYVKPRDKGSYELYTDALQGVVWQNACPDGDDGYQVRERLAPLGWVIVGGESGPRARRCDVAWIGDIIRQCRAAGVACFVKQLGRNPIDSTGGDLARSSTINDSKGGDINEWPAALRVREYP